MSWLGAVVEGVGLIADASQKSKAAKQQRQTLSEARNYATTGPLNDYATSGKQASDQTNELLGIGADNSPAGTQAAQSAFDKFLGSTGYKFNLQQGQAALDASAAAKGLTGSGSALKAAVGFGQNLGSSYYDKYLTQLSGVANRGEQAATAQTNAYGGLSTSIANSFTGEANAVGSDLTKATGDTADYLGFTDKSGGPQTPTPKATSTDASNTNGIFGTTPTTVNPQATNALYPGN